jgi:hypothetical protein
LPSYLKILANSPLISGRTIPTTCSIMSPILTE